MNKKLEIIGTIILLVLIPIAYNYFAHSHATSKWVTFTSSNGRFKVEFPQKPIEQTKVVESEYGQLPAHIIVYDGSKDNDPNLGYTISYVDYPDTVINSDATEKLGEFFKSIAQRGINTLHGKLDHETIESVNNYPGEEIKISFQDGKGVYREKNFLVKNRLYSIGVITDAKNDFNKSIDIFFASFQLL